MTEHDQSTALTELGYTSKWLEYGVLSAEQLEKDLAEWQQPAGDPNPEHYRYRILIAYVNHKSELSEAEFNHLLELLVKDPDPLMTNAFIIYYLLKRDILTERQFVAFGEHALAREAKISQAYLNCDLLRCLQRDGSTEDIIVRCLDAGDGEVHRKLLEYKDLPLHAVQALAERGANKAVRNIARQRLGSAQYGKAVKKP